MALFYRAMSRAEYRDPRQQKNSTLLKTHLKPNNFLSLVLRLWNLLKVLILRTTTLPMPSY